MSRGRCAGLVVVVVLAAARPVAADERRAGTTINGRFSIEETNDKFAIIESTDAQFTQGLKIRATWDPRWHTSPLSRCFYEKYRRKHKPNRTTVSFELGQDIYTPDDISPFREEDELEPGEPPLTTAQKEAEFDEWYRNEFPGDRPYSSELYGEFEITGYFTRRTLLSYVFPRLPRQGMMRWSVAARAGYVGAVMGGQIQKAVHVIMRGLEAGRKTPRDPQGWEFQQRENGFSTIRSTEIASKIGANGSAEVELDALNVDTPSRWPDVRLSVLAMAEAGQFRDLGGAGMRLELGYLGHDPYECFPRGGRQLVPPCRNTEPRPEVGGNVSTFAFYGYGQARGRLTLYNRHLDNRMFEDDAIEADRRWTDADLSLGVVARFWTFELELAHTAYIKATGQRDRGGLDHHVGTFKLSTLF